MVEGNVHFEIAARRGGVDGAYDSLNMRTKLWPLLLTENYDRDLAVRKVLLISHLLVGCKQKIKPGLFGN